MTPKPLNAPLWLARYLWHATGEVMVCVPAKVPAWTTEFSCRMVASALINEDNGRYRIVEVPFPYHPGDIVPVREPWSLVGDPHREDPNGIYRYPIYSCYKNDTGMYGAVKWKPSSTMPLEYVRQWLCVSSISCGPVAKISEDEAVMCGFRDVYDSAPTGEKDTAADCFIKQWHDDHPTRPEWCWMITGTVTRKDS